MLHVSKCLKIKIPCYEYDNLPISVISNQPLHRAPNPATPTTIAVGAQMVQLRKGGSGSRQTI